MKHRLKQFGCSLYVIAIVAIPGQAGAKGVADAFADGTTKVDFRLRYENVQQDNLLQDAEALTLRTRLTFATAETNGFSAVLELEDSRSVLGLDDFAVPPSGFKSGIYSVIADPKTTELDQAYIKYSGGNTSAKFGRQVIALGNQRFVGHVGWRQDRQTFDAIGLNHKFNKQFSAEYYYVMQRNRIFSNDADVDSDDHLLNLKYKSDVGTLTLYGYFLEVDNNIENSLDTIGVSFVGSKKMDAFKLSYAAEFATQESDTAATDFDANYWMFEAGLGYTNINVKLGIENLGSDNGAYGFATPLATLHKFNGWSDQFLGTPAQGLQDIYVKLIGKAFGGKYVIAWHDFSADDSTPRVNDFGTELNLQYTYAFNKHYSVGVKYANYSADDIRVDGDKWWLWFGAKF